MRLLVTGGSGTLGGSLVRQALADGHDVVATYATRPGEAAQARWLRLDVREPVDFAAIRPDAVIHTAYKQSDWRTTADGAANVAVAARAVGARLVHVSSDALFSGTASPYDERAVPDPIWPYGAAKAAAETAVGAIDPGAAIVRTSLIIGPRTTMPPVLFTDDIRCPVDVGDLAAALLEFAGCAHAGVFHAAGADALSRFELGMLVARRDGLDPAGFTKGPRTIPGPLDVRLDCRRTQALLKTRLRGAGEFVK